MSLTSRASARKRRHVRLRKKISGTCDRPRLSVTRSNRHVFVQAVDDISGKTLVSASTMEKDIRALELGKTERALAVGKLVAQRALAVGVKSAVFDRGGCKYTGRVAAVAEGAREAGLQT
ncbi:50S ribosomal protein L18 [Tropheryma whipplei]|uniref:Large ribosomal subunit protein uL18 n=2 Tax=Tropheryma whipplei TaxID=2039 RepID=RL18_TROWT|nr:50S ribosomal protein L18 [Tropheryma whipplei]Q83G01.1 RecName: Full=Large ribosomal subunit protein uL18; AltName: Full=50S ribosomal protein L18 [Tropheryma whipplei str. Twist]Q83I63.1 RecName: Full=Large ribosomal subunit protein uL18; AltName: Full=50S ribosomal protein L18 [Tropheryma whipplei TW08/27]AAO44636.1 50S ribosomal protein L18 [Tropheryma whipplei str. Twist]MCO8182566.1 50S ribosomal protein L18 [Tropheryma whipplei]MCO8189966.1 50S ribosomal protein L18 [Tropheryma whipp